MVSLMLLIIIIYIYTLITLYFIYLSGETNAKIGIDILVITIIFSRLLPLFQTIYSSWSSIKTQEFSILELRNYINQNIPLYIGCLIVAIGIYLIYGLIRLKVNCKICLFVHFLNAVILMIQII